jgi:hypothetical protein
MAAGKPEVMRENVPLEWDLKAKAIKAFIFPASKEGTPAINVRHWPKGTPTEYWTVTKGVLSRTRAHFTGPHGTPDF